MIVHSPQKFVSMIHLINKDTIEKLFLIAAYVIVLLALIQRIIYGVETTDEALYVAEGFIFTQGATPYANMWLHTSGFALLNAPFVWLYVFITGSTAGVMLYFRIISLLLKLIVALLICFIMRPHMKARITALWLLPFVAFVPHSIITMSYNTWSITLLMLACIMLTRTILSADQNQKLFLGSIAGSLIALTILSYPSSIITGIMLAALLFVHEEKVHRSGHRAFYGYLLGGFLTALVLTLFFVARTGDFNSLYEGLKIIVEDNPYLKMPKEITKESLHIFLIYIIKNWIVLVLVSYIFMRLPISNKETKAIFILIFILSFLFYHSFTICSNYLRIIRITVSYVQITDIICRLFFPISLILYQCIKQKNREAQILLLFILLPALIFYLSSSFSSIYGIRRNYYFLAQGTLLIIPFVYWAINDLTLLKHRKEASFWGTLLTGCMFIFIFLLNYYGYMYRDDSLAELDYKVKTGIYKGLYTTKTKGENLETLEKTIRSETNSTEKILFMDNVPMAYLMTDAQHCAPSTWDIQFYSYKFTDDAMLQKYFKATKRTPDKIIYIFTGIDKTLSIDSEDYKFNNYVNANYKLTSSTNGPFPIKIYERIPR